MGYSLEHLRESWGKTMESRTSYLLVPTEYRFPIMMVRMLVGLSWPAAVIADLKPLLQSFCKMLNHTAWSMCLFYSKKKKKTLEFRDNTNILLSAINICSIKSLNPSYYGLIWNLDGGTLGLSVETLHSLQTAWVGSGSASDSKHLLMCMLAAITYSCFFQLLGFKKKCPSKNSLLHFKEVLNCNTSDFCVYKNRLIFAAAVTNS